MHYSQFIGGILHLLDAQLYLLNAVFFTRSIQKQVSIETNTLVKTCQLHEFLLNQCMFYYLYNNKAQSQPALMFIINFNETY